MYSAVVTGIGLATPIGDTIEGFWDAVKKVGTVPTFSHRESRDCPYFLPASRSAVNDAGLTENHLARAAVTVSSSKGNDYLKNPASEIAVKFGCRGPSLNIITACATGLSSIIIGAGMIESGRAKVVISGGTDACVNEFMISAYKKLGVLAKDLCMPFDRRRDGFCLSEGAGVVVLEEEKHARSRGAKIYCRITGTAFLCDAYHITSINPDGEVIAEVIKRTCKNPAEVDYISAHGTGTVYNDLAETRAIKKVFGRYAYRIPINSIKPVTGHMLGASGAVEFISGILAMKYGFIPPTMNLAEPDPECDLDYVPLKSRRHNVNKLLKLSYGFGGHICGLEAEKI